MRLSTCRSLWSARPALLRRGLAAKAGKASSAAEAKPLAEAVGSISQPSDRPATDYPSWLSNLTEPGKTLGELKRTPAEQRSNHDDMRLLKLSSRAAIKSINFSKAKGI
ncbi:mitochondrial translation [Trebouxia sp. C0010 RCD-2024]